MGTFLTAVQSVLPLFLIIFTGFLFSKARIASFAWVDILNRYALWVGFPALIIHSLLRLDLSQESYSTLVGVNSVFIVTCILLAYPVSYLLRLPNEKRRVLFMVFAFGNVAYLGIPVLQSVYGDGILPEAAVLASVYLFWLLTLAIFLVDLHGGEEVHLQKLVRGLVRNPLLISVFTGLALVFLKIEIPVVATRSLSMLAGSVTPVILLSLGIFLGFQRLGHFREWGTVTVISLLIMLLFPGIYYAILVYADFPDFNFRASVLDAAMPMGLTPYAMAQQYKLDAPFTARIVMLSTALSLLVIPLWIMILG